MSYDIWIQPKNKKNKYKHVDETDDFSSIVGMKRNSSHHWIYDDSQAYMDIFLATIINEEGDSSTIGDTFQRVEIHEPYGQTEEASQICHHIRVKLAQILDWQMYDAQYAKYIYSPEKDIKYCLNPNACLPEDSKKSVKCINEGLFNTLGARPKCKIVAKDLEDSVDYLLILGNELFIITKTQYATRIDGIEIRDINTFELKNKISGQYKTEFSPTKNFLSTIGMCLRGDESTLDVIKLDDFSKAGSFEVVNPVVWLDDNHIIGQTPYFPTRVIEFNRNGYSHLPEDVVDEYEQEYKNELNKQRILKEKYGDFIVTDHKTNKWGQRKIIKMNLTDGSYEDVYNIWDNDLVRYHQLKNLLLTSDKKKLYICTNECIICLEYPSKKLIWQRRFGFYEDDNVFSLNVFELSPNETMIALGGLSSISKDPNDLLVVDAQTGETMISIRGLFHQYSIPSTVNCICWLNSQMFAIGFGSGQIVIADLRGQIRSWKACSKGIKAMIISPDGNSIIVAGTEKQLRVWELLEDEKGYKV